MPVFVNMAELMMDAAVNKLALVILNIMSFKKFPRQLKKITKMQV